MQRHKKHKNQMKGCAAELEVSDWQMNVWTLWACDTVKGQQGVVVDWYVIF